LSYVCIFFFLPAVITTGQFLSGVLILVFPTQEWGIAWNLREMGSIQGKGVREGQAPQAGRKISSQLPAKKEASWSRKKKEERVRHDEEEPACTE
jgi:hypothetical protein